MLALMGIAVGMVALVSLSLSSHALDVLCAGGINSLSGLSEGDGPDGSIATRSRIATVIDAIAAGRLQDVESSRPWLVAFYLQQEHEAIYISTFMRYRLAYLPILLNDALFKKKTQF